MSENNEEENKQEDVIENEEENKKEEISEKVEENKISSTNNIEKKNDENFNLINDSNNNNLNEEDTKLEEKNNEDNSSKEIPSLSIPQIQNNDKPKEISKKEILMKNYKINQKNTLYNMSLIIEDKMLNIKIINESVIPIIEYNSTFLLNEIKNEKYFYNCESIEEIFYELINLIEINENDDKDDKNIIYNCKIEESDDIIIKITLPFKKKKELILKISKITKDIDKIIYELSKVIKNLKNEIETIKEKNYEERINKLEEENRILTEINKKYKKIEEENNYYKNKINDFSKEIEILKLKTKTKQYTNYSNIQKIKKDSNILFLMTMKEYLIASIGKKICLFNLSSLEQVYSIELDSIAYYLYNNNDEILIATLESGKILFILLKSKDSHEIENQIEAHSGTCYKIIKLNNTFISCSADKTIKLWDSSSLEKKLEILAENTVECIFKISGNEIVSSSESDKSIVFWDLNTKQKISKLDNLPCKKANNIMNLVKNILIVGGHAKIFLIDIYKHSVIEKVDTNNCYIYCLYEIEENIYLTGDDEGNFVEWKYDNEHLTFISKRYKAHTTVLKCIIKIEQNTLITAGDDKFIKVWN